MKTARVTFVITFVMAVMTGPSLIQEWSGNGANHAYVNAGPSIGNLVVFGAILLIMWVSFIIALTPRRKSPRSNSTVDRP